MRIDPAELTPGSLLQADLCIVGGGPAGIALARSFIGTSTDVLLLEAGGKGPTDAAQAIYEGKVDAPFRPQELTYLTTSRVSAFGGSTHRWMGGIRTLDPLDLAPRSWVPHSGWPLSYDDLAAYHEPAAALVRAPRPAPPAFEGPRRAILDGNPLLETRLVHFSPTRFSRYLRELEAAPNVRVALQSPVLKLTANDAASRVELAEVGPPGGGFRVKAKRWVLAAGGVENARLLLLSSGEAPGGLGNDRDLVGRYFCDHPQMGFVGRLVAAGVADDAALGLYTAAGPDPRAPVRSRGVFQLRPEVQERERLLGCELHVSPPPKARVRNKERAVQALTRGFAATEGLPAESIVRAGITVRAEQTPNPDSRVVLTDALDAWKRRRVELRWRLTDADADSIRRSVTLFARGLGASLRGRARVMLSPREPWAQARGSSNHLGTTRMAADPAKGVVDAHCRVHGIDNLYIAGGSVFPTAGNVYPTLTIVALALRLGDHLRGG